MTTAATPSIQEILKQLRDPFSAKDIEWRVGSTNREKTIGQALPYLTFRAVADRLDDLLGPENWRTEYIPGAAGGVICRLSLRINGEWIAKENGAENTDIEAVKGGLSDAFKRAGAMWGLGRYLYAFNPPWIDLENRRLKKIPVLPDEFLPASERGKAKPETKAAATETVTQPTQATTEAAQPETEAAKSADKPAPVTAPQDKPADKLNDKPATAKATTTKAAAKPANDKPVETQPAAAEKPATPPAPTEQAASVEKPAADTTAATESAANDGGELPAGLTEAEITKVKDIIRRANSGVSIGALKSYVNGKGKESLSDTARDYLLAELDSLETA